MNIVDDSRRIVVGSGHLTGVVYALRDRVTAAPSVEYKKGPKLVAEEPMSHVLCINEVARYCSFIVHAGS
jgi:hypothetical protein